MNPYTTRAKSVENNTWVSGFVLYHKITDKYIMYESASTDAYQVRTETIGRFSGFYIKDVPLFEHDIVRNEIECEDGDELQYLICTWIKEWGMFALLMRAEYQDYRDNGADHLDESMFWTFPIDEKENEKRSICGNIFDKPEIIQY